VFINNNKFLPILFFLIYFNLNAKNIALIEVREHTIFDTEIPYGIFGGLLAGTVSCSTLWIYPVVFAGIYSIKKISEYNEEPLWIAKNKNSKSIFLLTLDSELHKNLTNYIQLKKLKIQNKYSSSEFLNDKLNDFFQLNGLKYSIRVLFSNDYLYWRVIDKNLDHFFFLKTLNSKRGIKIFCDKFKQEKFDN
jgi:hypothetical protein